MIKGGYQILDLKGTPFNEGAYTMTLDGIYEVLEGNYGKPVLLSGLVVNGKEYGDCFVDVNLNGTTYTIKCYNVTITIANTDAINVTIG